MQDLKVVKRDNSVVEYDHTKIYNAITKANKDIDETDRIAEDDIYGILSNIENIIKDKEYVNVEEIQDLVENQ